jgi:hypothetical protein
VKLPEELVQLVDLDQRRCRVPRSLLVRDASRIGNDEVFGRAKESLLGRRIYDAAKVWPAESLARRAALFRR